MPDTVGSEQHEPISLRGIAHRARARKHHRFRDLCRSLNAGFLLNCWGDLNKDAVSGVDEITAQAYQENLEANIQALAERLKPDAKAAAAARALGYIDPSSFSRAFRRWTGMSPRAYPRRD